jgi:hypothetical protein
MFSALPPEADFAGHRAKAYPRPTVLVCLVVLGSAGLAEMVQLLTPDRHSRLRMRSKRWRRCCRHRGCSSNPLFRANQPQVPELTRSADIKLNERISLMRAVTIVSSSQLRGVSPRPPTTTARSGVAASRKGTAAPPIPLPVHRLSRGTDCLSPHGSRAPLFCASRLADRHNLALQP